MKLNSGTPLRPRTLVPMVSALLVAILVAAQAGEQDFNELLALPQENQGMVLIIGVKAEAAAIMAARTSAMVADEDPDRAGPDLEDVPLANIPLEDLLLTISTWVEIRGAPKVTAVFERAAASERLGVEAMYEMMEALADNTRERTDRNTARISWLMGRGNLIDKATAVAWEQLLFAMVEELEQDPVKRMSLWDQAKSAVARQVYGTGERSH